MNKLITPMFVQYLVGLCCVRVHADAVDVTLGDMVLDPAAEKKRDVDVTVTMREPGGEITAFKAYEVKKESAPLDVSTVEQLGTKLNDMPSVTHRAIVSASGYTTSAIRKGLRHGVDLYTISPWTRPVREQFPELGLERVPQDCRLRGQVLPYGIAALQDLTPKCASMSVAKAEVTSTLLPSPLNRIRPHRNRYAKVSRRIGYEHLS